MSGEVYSFDATDPYTLECPRRSLGRMVMETSSTYPSVYQEVAGGDGYRNKILDFANRLDAPLLSEEISPCNEVIITKQVSQ